MATDEERPVVAATDGSPAAIEAAEWAAVEAARRGRRLELVHVPAWPGFVATTLPGWPNWDAEMFETVGCAALEETRLAVRAREPELPVSTEMIRGPVTEALVGRSAGTELLVLGRRGRGRFPDLIAGATVSQVAQYARCPVVVVPQHTTADEDGPGIVLGVDIAPGCEPAIGFAFEAATRCRLPITAVRGWTLLTDEPGILSLGPTRLSQELESEQRRLLSEALAGWCTKYPDVPVRTMTIREHAGRALVETSRGAHLLVVGARGAGGFAGLLLGSVSDTVVRHAPCPVAVVR